MQKGGGNDAGGGNQVKALKKGAAKGVREKTGSYKRYKREGVRKKRERFLCISDLLG